CVRRSCRLQKAEGKGAHFVGDLLGFDLAVHDDVHSRFRTLKKSQIPSPVSISGALSPARTCSTRDRRGTPTGGTSRTTCDISTPSGTSSPLVVQSTCGDSRRCPG